MSIQQTDTLEIRIDGLVSQMTLAEKIGQMTQIEKNSIPAEDVTNYFIGSVLSGGGGNPTPNTPDTWAKMVREYQEAALKTRLAIPLLYGSDCVHGHNNVYGATLFPHNIGLGATHDEKLVYEIAQVTAKEMLATGVHWNFAPAVSVPQDVRWGRTYEGFSENTDVVIKMSTAYIRGLQASGILPSIKHFVADGGAKWNTTIKPADQQANWQGVTDSYSIDQGDAQIDEETLRRVHLAPYVAAVKEGVLNIMVSHSSWQGLKMHAHHYLLTTVLKGELGFQGFLVSDWMSINQLDPDFYTCVVRSINAGLDMIMVPFDYKLFIETLSRAVANGDVSQERIDDAVRRILRAKFSLGLFEQPFGNDELIAEFGSDAHRALAREAVRKSLVLLKNENNLLPLAKSGDQILVAGCGANDIGMQCGGWTISWQGDYGATTVGTTLLEGMQQATSADVQYHATGDFGAAQAPLGIVVVGEKPYAEGVGDKGDLTLSMEEADLVKSMRQRCDKLILIVLSGRPLVIAEEHALADAVIAAWQPGTEGAGVADVLFGDYPFVGKSTYTWSRDAAQVSLDALKANPGAVLIPFGYSS